MYGFAQVKLVPLWSDFMKDNVMYYPAIVLMIIEAGALTFLITEWIKANKNK